ncbi:hypothetical protein SLA_5023 [Streptomyces laurentii]|uniref:Uncharacterized protein n=2 Tax=Streptomyces laurentii TaxID=39478 RepID=A0A160P2X6_STRLU|nr:hypothetical protein SLA_5023 [Streptomyces laurentii]
MISMNTINTRNAKVNDRLVVSACSLGFSTVVAYPSVIGTGLSGAGMPLGASALLMDRLEHSERPTKALEAGVAGKAQASAFGFAATATGAGIQQQTTHDHTMWAFRGLEPWSDPV